MNHKTDMQAALQACVDVMLHDGVPTDPYHPRRVALNAAEVALAFGPDAQADERGAIYVECRECAECGHIGINDSHPTDAACDYSCDWTGPSPIKDKCPGCGNENVMTDACPKCSGRYKFMADATIQTSVAAPKVVAQGVPEGWADQARKALAPFASIGQWLFARSLPDDMPVVDVRGLNGQASALTRGMFKAAHMALSTAPSPDREQATLCEDGGKCGIGGYCGQCEKVRAASDPEQPSERGERPIEPEDIDAVAEAIQRETSVEWLIASRAAVAAIDTLIARGNHASERGEQECPHGVDDGACKQCYGEATRGEQWTAEAKCKACNGNDGDMPCAYPEGRPDCLRNASAPALDDGVIPADCDVRKILLRVVPGDGDGYEVYAKNVGDVENLLCELGQRLEDFELARAQQPQAAEPKGLTDEERSAIRSASLNSYMTTAQRDCLRALLEKNGGGNDK